MENLTITSVIQHFNFSSGNTGTLVVFDKSYPKGHAREGKSIMKSYVGIEDYIPQSKTGWTFDPTSGRINEPVVTKEGLEERKFMFAQKYGVALAV